MQILGIDPGSRITGFGLIKLDQGRRIYVASGCINVAKDNFATRLGKIFNGIIDIIRQFNPDQIAFETVFTRKNIDSAIKLSHARGSAMAAIASFNLNNNIFNTEIAEYSPRKIKKSVVGYGAADKLQIQHMVQTILGLDKFPGADAADALAIAICHSNNINTLIKKEK